MKLKLISLGLLALALSACDKTQEIKNGELPAELIPFAQKLTGNYDGKFEGISNSISVTLVGNKLMVTPAHDLLGNACESRVGDLTAVAYSAKDKNIVELTRASFELDRGRCGLNYEGGSLDFSGKNHKDGSYELRASVLIGYHWESRFEPGRAICDSHGRCWQTGGRIYNERVPDYAYGEFTRH